MLPEKNRLNLATEFRILKKDSQSIATPFFTILYRFSVSSEPRGGFIVSNKIGKAVVRNEFRRKLRELVQQRLDRLSAGLELVLIAKPVKEVPSYEELSIEFDKVLPKLSSRNNS